jgi:isocitrate lyase
MHLRSQHRASAALLVLWLGGCTSAAVADRPMRIGKNHPAESTVPLKSHADLIKGFDKTLTEAERRAVVTELQQDRERQARLR